MYAVKGGHTDTVRELMKYDFIRCDIENKVLAPSTHYSLSHAP